jgi:hypothetical protein
MNDLQQFECYNFQKSMSAIALVDLFLFGNSFKIEELVQHFSKRFGIATFTRRL